MDNNDILIRLRYALDIKNSDMVGIFKFGGVELTIEEVLKILKKSNESDIEEADYDMIQVKMKKILNAIITC